MKMTNIENLLIIIEEQNICSLWDLFEYLIIHEDELDYRSRLYLNYVMENVDVIKAYISTLNRKRETKKGGSGSSETMDRT